MWEPFWAAAEELEMPVNIHIVTAQVAPTRRLTALRQKAVEWLQGRSKRVRRRERVDGSLANAVLSHSRGVRTILDMIAAGVMERHPRLNVVSVENDIGWLPHHLKAMEHYSQRFAGRYPRMKLSAAEYWRRQVYATFQDDESGVRCRDLIGVDRLMWASDYPHFDSTFPNSREAIERNFAGVSEADRRLILGENMRRLYRLDN
jgi:predicted TIM-barrel fold metal-dependent hydrolase